MKPEGVALVTGAGRGLGRAIAVELARRGFDVHATMRDPQAGADLPALSGAAAEGVPGPRSGRLTASALDITRPGGFSPPEGLRVLVANAGVRGPYLPVEEDQTERWREVFETNVFGTYEIVRRCVPELRASGGGVICLVTSASILKPMPFFGAYRASKAALSALGETLQAELAQYGVRLLEIQPGPIDTDLMNDSVLRRPPEAASFAAYRELADRAYPQSSRNGAYPVTSPEQAAANVADAILDDSAPLRVGCDVWSVGMLADWRGRSDEEYLREALAQWE